jgi:outer membrane protein TolC
VNFRRVFGVAALLAAVGARAAGAQTGAQVGARPDSQPAVLDFATFTRQVLAAHPVVRQAGLVRQQAREELRVARGAFDPTVTATVDRKAFNNTLYYDYVEGEIKVPTPLGSDLKFGFERAIGNRISADRYTGAPLGNPGIFKLGLSVPVGQRLITDERRNALALARALQDVAEGDRRAAVNKLLLDAAKDYAAWYEADRRRAVAREGVALAEFRLRAVRARVAAGEAAAIDTVEALLEVQARTVTRRDAEQQYYAAALAVSNHLWDERAAPLDLEPDVVPTLAGLESAPVDSTRLPRWLELAARQHPELRKIAGRVDQAEAQRLFALQQVLPFAELSLNSVAGRNDVGGLTAGNRFDNSYVLGGTVRTPLLFMRERGRFNLADQRLEQQELEATRLRRLVELEVRQAVNDLATVHAIIGLQRETVAQARALLRGEQRRFEGGESSLLVVNLRERRVIEEELKLAAYEAKYASARATLGVAIGEPGVVPE